MNEKSNSTKFYSNLILNNLNYNYSGSLLRFLYNVKFNLNRKNLITEISKCDSLFSLDSILKNSFANENAFLLNEEDFIRLHFSNSLTKIIYEHKLGLLVSMYKNKINKTTERIKIADNIIKHMDYSNYKKIDVKYFDFLKGPNDNLLKMAENLAINDNKRIINETKIKYLEPLKDSLKSQEFLLNSSSEILSKKFNLLLMYINKNYLKEFVLLEKSNFYHFIKSISNDSNLHILKDFKFSNSISDKLIKASIKKIETHTDETYKLLGKEFSNLYNKYGFINKSDVLEIIKNLNFIIESSKTKNQLSKLFGLVLKESNNNIESYKTLTEIYTDIDINEYHKFIMNDDLKKIKLYFMLNELSKNI